MAYPYATIDDVFSRYAPIHTMVGTGNNEVSSAEVSSVFIGDAQSFMDAHLGKRYVVPVAAEPLITQIATDLAIANMMHEKLGEIPNFIQPRYDRAISMLDKLSEGKMILTSNSTTLTSSYDSFAWSSTQSYHSIFSPVLGELDQAADQDRIDADKNERSDDTGVDAC